MPTFECPICRKIIRVSRLADASYRPFCSQRCKLVDLGRWLDGTYSISEPVSHDEPDRPANGRAEDDNS